MGSGTRGVFFFYLILVWLIHYTLHELGPFLFMLEPNWETTTSHGPDVHGRVWREKKCLVTLYRFSWTLPERWWHQSDCRILIIVFIFRISHMISIVQTRGDYKLMSLTVESERHKQHTTIPRWSLTSWNGCTDTVTFTMASCFFNSSVPVYSDQTFFSANIWPVGLGCLHAVVYWLQWGNHEFFEGITQTPYSFKHGV